MCNCKMTPLQKAERRLVVNGWSKMAPSDMKLIDGYIHMVLGVYPTTQQEREELYQTAKTK